MIKVEAYRAQSGLTQCFNYQQFGHVWANCRQPPRCLWCGGGRLHKECPEAEKENSTPNCCNCNLQEGERPHLPATEAAAMQRRSRSGGGTRDPSTRELQGGRSPPTMSPPGSRSQLRCNVTQGSSLRCDRLRKQKGQQRNQ
jgi:hypothetical protein